MFEINDLYGYKNYDFLNDSLKKIIKHLKIEDAIFSIVFIGDEKMQELNKKYRNMDKTTDVLSFAFEDNENMHYNEFRILGDIYISIPKMIEQAKQYNFKEERELTFLVIHGLLHLLGYNHEEPNEETVMFSLQEDLLNGKF